MNELHDCINSGKLLVVEDNPVVSYLLEQILLRDGYEVIKASNGQEAVEKLSEESVDLILSDVMMPQMDGGQLCRYVRQVLELNSLPFIILTASNEDSEMARVYRLGIDDYLTKPCEPELLLAVIRGHIQRAKSHQTELERRFDNFRRRVINTLSHEFRTPLMAINAGAEVLLTRNKNEDLADAVSLIKAIQKGGERLEGLVNDFMCMQQIESGHAAGFYQRSIQPVTLDQLLRDLHERLSNFSDDRYNEVSLKNRAHGRILHICEEQILNALLRLIGNSIKFSEAKSEIEVVFECEENYVLLSVYDRGIGFKNGPLENRLGTAANQAGMPFVQLNREILEQQGGGLGLAIAKGYAELHGGALLIRPRSGGGSVVSLKLPLKEDSLGRNLL